mmetsp:Transcript_55074/g.103242  ORF Transcript_55074/g.103242 Transcript_55074/m.103242 type:complete len:578 (+) Transcript_55074:69-1802(+)
MAAQGKRWAAPADCQEKLAELQKRFAFGDIDLECFELNSGALNASKLREFEAHLQRSKEKRVPKPPPVRDQARPLGRDSLKRPRLPDVARLGQVPALAKRLAREEELGQSLVRAEAAEEPPQPTLQVSVKSSINASSIAGQSQSRLAKVTVLENSQPGGGQVGAYRWLNEKISDRAAHRDERLQEWEPLLAAEMQPRAPEAALGVVHVPCQTESILCGRIACEGLEGRLNQNSIMLEGPSALNSKVRLNIADCKQVAAFPGQIVSVVGRSGMTGNTFHARDFLPGLPAKGQAANPESSLHALIVAGPFSQRDRLDYTALRSVLAHAEVERPEVLILLGPLLDANNSKAAAGDASMDDQEPCCFEEVYAQLLAELKRSLEPLRRANPPTEVLIVPSLEEVVGFHPLPQPPLDVTLQDWLAPEISDLRELQRMGVRFLPNPAHVELNGIKVSLTSADALTPIMREMVLRPEGRKVEEALRLLLLQRCLFPAVPRDPAQVCESRARCLDFPEDGLPHVCIFPSPVGVMNGTVVEGTLFVNPGSLCRQAAAGSFAELWIRTSSGESDTLKDRMRLDLKKLG